MKALAIPRGFATLLTGSGATIALQAVALPLLARLYDPVAFGQFGAVMATVSLAAVLVHGRYQMGLPVERHGRDARALLWLALALPLALSLPVVALVHTLFGKTPEGIGTASFIAIATALTLGTAWLDVLAYWRARHGKFRRSATIALARAVATVAAQAALFMVGYASGGGLVAGASLGIALALILGAQSSVPLAAPKPDRLRRVAHAHRAHPMFGVPQGWLAALSWNAMPLLLLRYADTAFAGQYWLAYRLLLAPVTAFGGAYRQTMLPALRGATMDAGRRLALRHSLALLALAVLPALALHLFGPAIFAAIMGERWREAGTIAAWMGLAISADAIKIPTLCWLQATGRQRSIMTFEAVAVVVRYAAAIPALMTNQPLLAIAIFATLGLAGWALFIAFQLRPRGRTVNAG